jgi:hypothetical protein
MTAKVSISYLHQLMKTISAGGWLFWLAVQSVALAKWRW